MRTLFRPWTTSLFSQLAIVAVSFASGGVVALLAFGSLSPAAGMGARQVAERAVATVTTGATLQVEAHSPTALPTETPASQPALVSKPSSTPEPTKASVSTPQTVPASDSTPVRVATAQSDTPSRRRLPDLAMLPVSGLEGGALKRGQPALAVFQGTNRGEADAYNVSVRVEIQLGVFGVFVPMYNSSETVPVIKVGETMRRVQSGTVPNEVAPGTYRLRVTIDPDNAIEESDEGNNTVVTEVALQ